MIQLTLPNSAMLTFENPITGLELLNHLPAKVAKTAVAMKLDAQLYDLTRNIEHNTKVAIITESDADALEVIRHDTAHLLAHAVQELYPEVQITIGPVIEDGFFYDFAKDTPFHIDDLPIIEAKMREIAARGDQIIRESWTRDKAIEFFQNAGEYYKVELIKAIPEDQEITLYRQGSFIDLCRGPHARSTKYLKYFKLLKIAGAYWRGNSTNPMLQRIYGTAWSSAKQLDEYLFRLTEAAKRDHRKLGQELNLFHIQDEAKGMIFWHPYGWTIYSTIQRYIREKLIKNQYQEVNTPILVDRKLWEASGHWEKFGHNMFTSETIDQEVLALKPMNCPCHVQIFKQGIKSYRDLPLRMAEFGVCHRYEPSGALHGLMRVRSFLQDDAHIFCTEEQINNETFLFCKLLVEIYNDFGFKDIRVKFSDRPAVRAGDDKTWDKAEQSLKVAIQKAGFDYELNSGEGAFYGPKLEFVHKDAIGREWQCGTLQVDFILPERLDAHYINSEGNKASPVMLHRAVLGSFERFIGILIEEYEGKFPLWLAPVQIAIATITSQADDYARKVYQALLKANIRAEMDLSNEKINYKIRRLSLQKVPLIAVLGKQEADNNTINLRTLGTNEQTNPTLEQLLELINNQVKTYFN